MRTHEDVALRWFGLARTGLKELSSDSMDWKLTVSGQTGVGSPDKSHVEAKNFLEFVLLVVCCGCGSGTIWGSIIVLNWSLIILNFAHLAWDGIVPRQRPITCVENAKR